MNKHVLITIFALAISGCAGSAMKNTDPFNFAYEPIASTGYESIEYYLNEAAQSLDQSGYSVTPNFVFYTATTLPKSIGKHRWRRNGEKWDLSYQLGVQILHGSNGQLFWRLTHKITGTRSGREPRLFQPVDFDKTEKLVNEMHRKLSIAFSPRA